MLDSGNGTQVGDYCVDVIVGQLRVTLPRHGPEPAIAVTGVAGANRIGDLGVRQQPDAGFFVRSNIGREDNAGMFSLERVGPRDARLRTRKRTLHVGCSLESAVRMTGAATQQDDEVTPPVDGVPVGGRKAATHWGRCVDDTGILEALVVVKRLDRAFRRASRE